MKLFNTIAASVAVAMAAGVAHADVNSQLASLQAQVNQLQTQVSTSGGSMGGVVGVDPALSWQMMGNQSGVGREMYLLQARQNGLNTPVTVGGFAQADAFYQTTNKKGTFNNLPFGYAGTKFVGNATPGSNAGSATRLNLSNADLAITAAIGQWVTAYMQTGASFIGQGGSDNLGIQDAYVVFGNLAKNPVYGFAGKKDIDFGSFQTVDMYNQPLTTALFAAVGNTAGVGVNAYGFNGTVSLMNGGSVTGGTKNNQGSASNIATSGSSSTNFGDNYAVNLSYGMTNSGVTWNVGAGYLAGSQFTNTTLNSGKTTNSNPAWDVNGKVSVAGFDFIAEYVATTSSTYGKSTYGSVASSVADAWSVGADYNFPVMGLNSVVSLEYSSAKLNGGASYLYAPNQTVVGYRIEPVNNVWTGLEYSYNKGNLLAQSNGTSALATSTILWDVTAAF